jgi:putative DNA primase/helicase
METTEVKTFDPAVLNSLHQSTERTNNKPVTDPPESGDAVVSVSNIGDKATPHDELLQKLIGQIKPIDFESLAFPQAKSLKLRLAELDKKLTNPDGSMNTDKSLFFEREQWKKVQKELDDLRLSQKHYLILTIEQVLKLAKENDWGLCKNHDFIYSYNGAFWDQLDKESFQHFLGASAEKMGVAKYQARFYDFREKLFKQFLATAYLSAPKPTNEKVYINLLNGTFEVNPKNGKVNLRVFDRSDFLTYQLPFEYDPNTKAPIFEAYLNKVLPDKERQQVLAEYLGYVFVKHGSGVLKEEKALILYGSGANGKSVFFEVVSALFGNQNVSNYSLQNLTEERGFYRAKIGNKLVNYASEINGKLETSLFKAMVSGEPVEACLKYGQPYTMTDYAKFIFNCNELPKEVENTNAYFRRFLIVPFDVTIPEDQQDKALHNKIIESELSGVFNWVIKGLHRLLIQKRFSHCEASKKAVERYQLESDSVQMFLAEAEYKPDPVADKPLKDFHKEYRLYCEESGFKVASISTFSQRLRKSGFIIERKNFGNTVYCTKK